MASLLRLARSVRPTATSLSSRPIAPNFFVSSRVGFRPGPAAPVAPFHHVLRARLYSSRPHARDFTSINMKLIYGVIGLNCSIFLYSTYVVEQHKQGFPKPFAHFYKNFTLNIHNFLEGQYWTSLTSVFTHMGVMHLLGNMISFYYMGQLLAYTPSFGPGRFLTLIIGSGLSGSAGYLYIHGKRVIDSGVPDQKHGLGFSGALMGVGAVAACMYPKVTFQLYGIVPIPLWALVTGYAVIDGYYLNDARSSTAHEGHLGGMAFGLLYYFLRLRRCYLGGL